MQKAIIVLFVGLCIFATMSNAFPQVFQVFQPEEKQGGFVLDVNKERGDGTKVDARARQEIWRSQDGNSRAEVYGHWDRTYGGRNDGQRSHGYGGRFEHSWGK